MSRTESARRSAKFKGLEPEARRADAELRVDAEVKIVTPVYGGGARTMEKGVSPLRGEVTPIRSSAVRGALRAWWRRWAMLKKDRGELYRQQEALLWGWADNHLGTIKGAVSVYVDTQKLGPPTIKRASADLKYATWPIEMADGAAELASFNGSLRIVVQLDRSLVEAPAAEGGAPKPRAAWAEAWPQHAADDSADGLVGQLWHEVLLALRAFTTFGGVGARTRRGFGALYWPGDSKAKHPLCKPLTVEQVAAALGWEKRIAARREVQGQRPDPAELAAIAHQKGLEVMQNYRLGMRLGRTHRTHRSPWPEANLLRRVRDGDLRGDVQLVLPRAAFGLPLHFKFPNEGASRTQKWELRPLGPDGKSAGRFPSPVFLRPFVDHGDGGGVRARPGVLLLGYPQRIVQAALSRVVVLNPGGEGGGASFRGMFQEEAYRAKDFRAEVAPVQPLAYALALGPKAEDTVLLPFLNYFQPKKS
jgi:CRISPR-associated protein Cmr1